MPWIPEYSTINSQGTSVSYETFETNYNFKGERRDRVKVSGRVVHEGHASDGRAYFVYRTHAYK